MEYQILMHSQGVSFPAGMNPDERAARMKSFRESAQRMLLGGSTAGRERNRPHMVPLENGGVVVRLPAPREPVSRHFQEGCPQPERRGLQYTFPQLPDHNVGLFHTNAQGERLLVGVVSPRRTALYRYLHS